MRKIVTLLLLIALLCGAASALTEGAGIADRVSAQGLVTEISDNPDGSIRCDFHDLSDGRASIEWSDAAHTCLASGEQGVIARLYVEALAMGEWDSCRATVNGVALLSYGAESAERFDTLEQYVAQMRATLGVQPPETGAPGEVRDYVLNRKSGKFHYPDCPGVGKMSEKNRMDFTGTRDELIAQGYSPCGSCKP